MRRIFIALIAGGLLLMSGVAASAKPDSSTRENGQHGQQQNQTQSDKKTALKPAVKPATTATKPATAATKAATSAATSTASIQGQCGFQGEQTGEHDDAACDDKQGQAGVNEPKNEAKDKADLPEKDSNKQGNNQD